MYLSQTYKQHFFQTLQIYEKHGIFMSKRKDYIYSYVLHTALFRSQFISGSINAQYTSYNQFKPFSL